MIRGTKTVSRAGKVVRLSKKKLAAFCKVQGGHTFDGPDDPNKCIHCGTPRAPRNTFARLAFIKWWHDSWRALWLQIGVEQMRAAARAVLVRVVNDEVEDLGGSMPTDPLMKAFLKAAMIDHKLRHPRARGDRLWVNRNPTGRGRADVACRFCGRILLTDQPLSYWPPSDVIRHTVECAITTLATGSSVDPSKGKS